MISRGKERNEVAHRVIGEMRARWGDRPIDEFKKADIYMMQQELIEDRGLAKKSSIDPTYLRAMLNFGVEELDLQFVPPKIKLLEENKRTNYLEPDQIQRLLNNLDPLRSDMAKFAVHTGMRNNNVRTLRWRYVSRDFRDRDTCSRDEEQQAVVYSSRSNILKRRHNEKLDLEHDTHGWVRLLRVFPACGNPLSVKAVCNKTEEGGWRRLPEGTTFHTLRHTFASLHIKNGTKPSSSRS